MDSSEDTHLIKPSPLLRASLLSKLFFAWVFPLMKKGAEKDLNINDLYCALPEDSSEKLGNYVEGKWSEEIIQAKLQQRAPKLWRVIRRMVWKKYFLAGFGYSFNELFLRVLQPIVLKNFIGSFNNKDGPEQIGTQCFYAAALVLITVVQGLIGQQACDLTIHLAMQVKIALSSLIYRKILKLRKVDSKNLNVGKLCNLLSNDVGRFEYGFLFFHYFYICPLQLVIYGYLLWSEIGWTSLGGIGCVLFFLPFQVFVGRFSAYFRTRISNRTDERGSFLSEIVSGIRLIKMYAWEEPFSKMVSRLRKAEIEFIRKGLYLRGAFLSLNVISQKLIPFCGLILYVMTGNTLTAETAFYTISIFAALQTIIHRVPTAASQLGEVIASINRIQEFLMAEEKSSAKRGNLRKKALSNGMGLDIAIARNTGSPLTKPSIILENYTASWREEKGQETVKNLKMNLSGDSLVMVVGQVGSGKSSFLNAILSELPVVSSGHCSVEGQLSYASQEPWIFPASVRQNILFGLEMDYDRYWKVIKLCCLEDDLNQFQYGDFTLVGERGVALSGGQKARLNMARCLYQNADIYLFDDPFSAVDSKVSRLLFEKCIKNHLRGKLRILVTHQLQYMPMADYIVVLNREGRIWFQGTYTDLKKSEMDLSSLINSSMPELDEPIADEGSQPKVLEEFPNRSKSISSTITGQKDKDMPNNGINKKDVGSHKSMKAESSKPSSVGLEAYLNYFKSGKSCFMMVLILLGFITYQLLLNSLDFWIGLWTNSIMNRKSSLCEDTKTEVLWGTRREDNETCVKAEYGNSFQNFYMYVYCGIMTTFILMTLLQKILFFRYCMAISVNLHNSMFKSLVKAPVKFFDDNPSGRIMNRFTKDLSQVDEMLPLALNDYANVILSLSGMLAINIAANFFVAAPAILLLAGLWKLREFYLSTARDLKRIEGVVKSPMLTHIKMTAQGLVTIRALDAQSTVLSQFEKIQDIHSAAFFMSFSASHWFSVWLEVVSCIFLTVVAFGFILLAPASQSGSVGMAISSILSIVGTLNWGIRQSAQAENYMTSVERVSEYCNLDSEEPLQNSNDELIPKSWPSEGRLNFHSVSLAYDELAENKVLKEVTFSTNPGEKIGIVGRTGAGKSSLITALFRMTELCDGVISIDDVETQNLGLHTLRSRISIIPQDPVLFTGSLRYNLDPFDEFSDDQLWAVLQEVDLHFTIQDLKFKVVDGGSNFSAGEKQLISLARVLLRKNQILILDEPTSNVDPVTDQMVQKTIRTKFSGCTVITIAHRLQTLLDSDRILVLDAGRVKEFESPKVLSEDSKSHFSEMLKNITRL